MAESFGDLDPRSISARPTSRPVQAWTGWHAIEKDLWPPADGDYTPFTDVRASRIWPTSSSADTAELVHTGAGPRVLSTRPSWGTVPRSCSTRWPPGKVTGEEEIWSHTDLWDFQANVDGARIAFEALEPVVRSKDPDLADTAHRAVRRSAVDARPASARRGVRVLRRPHRRARSKRLADSVERAEPSRCPS